MPVARTRSVALLGLTGSVVEVEADLSSQLPGFVIIGLPDAALAEARERVRSAAVNAGCPLPQRKLTVNLSPAALPKHGSGFDLAIALACLAAAGELSAESVDRVRPPRRTRARRAAPADRRDPARRARRGASRARHGDGPHGERGRGGAGARRRGRSASPRCSRRRSGMAASSTIDPVEPVPALSRTERDRRARDRRPRRRRRATTTPSTRSSSAAAGGHHLYLLGPPGAGKTMLASRLPGILPDLDADAALEVSSIRSLSGRALGAELAIRPPFEAPHHTATAAAIVGGGSRVIRPGAAARAVPRRALPRRGTRVPGRSARRAPAAARVRHASASIGRTRSRIVPRPIPARDRREPVPVRRLRRARRPTCTCPPATRRRYLARISGPLLDRIDLQVRVPRITIAAAPDAPTQSRGVSSEAARARVVAARARGAGATARHAMAHQRRDAGPVAARRRRPASRRPASAPARPRARARRHHDARVRPRAARPHGRSPTSKAPAPPGPNTSAGRSTSGRGSTV